MAEEIKSVIGQGEKMKYSGAQIIIKILEQQGIKIIAGIPGGSNLPLYDALAKSSIQHILARHEQGAGFIAQGMARSTGKPAVCFATSGPGATNLLTAIADAKMDSIPVIAITGQVPVRMIGTDAFQEVDTYGMTLQITKYNFLVKSAAELLNVIPAAFKIAMSGRPGPVLIDVPKDVQTQVVEVGVWPHHAQKEQSPPVNHRQISDAAEMIDQSKQPVLYLGGGIIHSGAHDLAYALAKKNSIPAACTLMALGCFPEDDPLYLGMLGMHARRATNLIMYEADLLIAIGARFDDRAIGNAQKFCPSARVVHIDIDSAELGKIRHANVAVCADAKSAIEQIMPLAAKKSRAKWNRYVQAMKTKYPRQVYADPLHPANLIRAVASIVDDDTVITTDVGQHQMWVAQNYWFKMPRTFLTSGGLGTMGFGLPAAIGAGLANPDKKVVCFSGDGSLLMNIQELATLAELELDVKILVMNNGHLGLVRQQQELFYQENYIASKFSRSPNFAAIARDFGMQSCDLAQASDPIESLGQTLTQSGPCLINVPIHPQENVLPIVPPGAGNCEMLGE